MKKFLVGVVAAMMAVLLCFSLAGCDKSDKIKNAFEGEGYTVAEANLKDDKTKELLKIALTNDQIEKVGEYSVFVCSEKVVINVTVALYIKFPSGGELKNFMTVEDSEGKKDTSSYDKANDNGWINGNCLLLTLSPKALEVFKNA